MAIIPMPPGVKEINYPNRKIPIPPLSMTPLLHLPAALPGLASFISSMKSTLYLVPLAALL